MTKAGAEDRVIRALHDAARCREVEVDDHGDRPLGDDEMAQLWSGVASRLPRQRAEVEPPPPRQRAEVVPFPPRKKKPWLPSVVQWLAPPCLLAAAITLFVKVAPGEDLATWSPSRGGEDAPKTLDAPDARFTEVIHRVAKGPLVVRRTLLVQNGRPRRWEPQLDGPSGGDPSQDKAILIAGTKTQLFAGVPSGQWDMLVAVGAPGEPPSDEDMMRYAGKAPHAGYQVLPPRRVLLRGCAPTREQPCRGDTETP